MLIHDSLDAAERPSLNGAHAARPPRSPARLLAEACWFTLWHAAMAVSGAFDLWVLAERVRRERHALGSLDDAALADIGVDRARAKHEASRGYLDIPLARRALRD